MRPGKASPGPSVSSPAEPSPVIDRFHDLMDRFLETQRAVMLAYLGRRPLDRGTERTPSTTRPTPRAVPTPIPMRWQG